MKFSSIILALLFISTSTLLSQGKFYGEYDNLKYLYISTIGITDTGINPQFGTTTKMFRSKVSISRTGLNMKFYGYSTLLGEIQLGKILSEPKTFSQVDKFDTTYAKYYNPKNSGSTSIIQKQSIFRDPVVSVFEFENFNGYSLIYMTTVSAIELNETTLRSIFMDMFDRVSELN